MLKICLGALTGSALYVFSNAPAAGANRVSYYLAGMAVLALTSSWALRAGYSAFRARARTAAYLLRSKRIVAGPEPVSPAGWAPLVETTRHITLGESRIEERKTKVTVGA